MASQDDHICKSLQKFLKLLACWKSFKAKKGFHEETQYLLSFSSVIEFYFVRSSEVRWDNHVSPIHGEPLQFCMPNTVVWPWGKQRNGLGAFGNPWSFAPRILMDMSWTRLNCSFLSNAWSCQCKCMTRSTFHIQTPSFQVYPARIWVFCFLIRNSNCTRDICFDSRWLVHTSSRKVPHSPGT